MPTHGSNALAVRRAEDGSAWISVDSLVEMFHDMAAPMKADSPQCQLLQTLTDVFAPISSYDEITELASDDGSRPIARRCRCGLPVIDAAALGGEPVTVNAESAEDGDWYVFEVKAGAVRVARWEAKLDGIDVVRLAEHTCPVAGGAR